MRNFFFKKIKFKDNYLSPKKHFQIIFEDKTIAKLMLKKDNKLAEKYIFKKTLNEIKNY